MALFGKAGSAISEKTINQEKIRYLKLFCNMDKKITRRANEISYWREKLEHVTSVPSATPKGGGSIYPKAESIVARIIDLEASLNRDIDVLIDIKYIINEIIEKIEDDRERLLLEYRYIDCKTFEWIAAEMELSWQWTHELHGRALSKIQLEHLIELYNRKVI